MQRVVGGEKYPTISQVTVLGIVGNRLGFVWPSKPVAQGRMY